MNRTTWALAAALLAACGGDGTGNTNPPPPPPVVAAVEVSPPAASVVEGGTVTLTAVVKDQNGASMSGQAVAWSTGDAAKATVSQTGLVTALTAGAATITASASGKTGTSTITVTPGPQIEVDAGSAATSDIGANGGKLTATAGGLSYALEIPVGAVLEKTRITLTPVKALRRLPAEGEFVAAVKLEPAGLVFNRPAVLKIRATVPPSAGKALLGYLADDSGELKTFAPATVKGDSLMVEVPHFTIAGWGKFSPGGLPPLPPVPQNPTATFFEDLVSLAVASAGSHGSLSVFTPLFRDWYEQLVRPALEGHHPVIDAEQSLYEFDRWVERLNWTDFVLNFNHTLVADLSQEHAGGLFEVPGAAFFGIRDRNRECVGGFMDPIEAATRVLQIQAMAAKYLAAADLGPEQLDTPTVLEGLCVKVVNSQADFPASPVPNQSATLNLRYGYRVGTDPLLEDAVFKVTALIHGTTSDGTQVSQTDAQGKLVGSVVPTGTTNLVIGLTSCIHPSLGPRLDEVCFSHEITHAFGRVITGSVTIESDAGLAQIADVSKIEGGLTIQGANVTSTDLHELSQLSEITGALFITGLPNLNTLAGMASLRSVPILFIGGNPALHDPILPAPLLSVRVVVLVGQAVTSVAGLAQLPEIAALSLNQVSVQSLAPLGNVLITNQLTIAQTPALTSLAGLKLAPRLETLILIDAPALTDVSALGGVTEVDQLTLENSGPVTFSLPGLTKVNQTLSLVPDAKMLGYQFPALQTVRSLSVDVHAACAGRASPLAIGVSGMTLARFTYRGPNASAPNCVSGLSMASRSLESVRISGGGITTFTSAHVQNAPADGGQLSIRNAIDLTQVAISGAVDLNGALDIRSNPILHSISFGGSVTVQGPAGAPNLGTFAICNHPALTGLSFGAPVVVSGAVEITGNPQLPIPDDPPWPITATTRRITAASVGCS